MATPKRKGASAGGAGPSQLAGKRNGQVPDYTKNDPPASVTPYQTERARLRSFAGWRMREIVTLAMFRRREGFVIDGNRFASALAFTLSCDQPGRVLISGKAEDRGKPRLVPWLGLNLETLRRAIVSAELGEFEDAELLTIIADVERWRERHGSRLATAKRLGLDLALTTIEREACNIRTIRAVDVTEEEREIIQRDKKRSRDASYNRTKRGRQPRAVYLADAAEKRRFCAEHGITDRTLRNWLKAGKAAFRSATLHKIDGVTSDFGNPKEQDANGFAADPSGTGRPGRSVARAAGGTEFPELGTEIIERSGIGSYVSGSSSARSRGLGVSRMSKKEAQMVTFDPSAAIAALLEAETVLSERAETQKLSASIGLFRLQLEIEAETQAEDGADALRIGIEHLVPRLRAANDNRLSSILRRLAA